MLTHWTSGGPENREALPARAANITIQKTFVACDALNRYFFVAFLWLLRGWSGHCRAWRRHCLWPFPGCFAFRLCGFHLAFGLRGRPTGSPSRALCFGLCEHSPKGSLSQRQSFTRCCCCLLPATLARGIGVTVQVLSHVCSLIQQALSSSC